MSSEAHITRLVRYPVKGFSGDTLDEVILRDGENFPFDRLYAIENGPSGFNREDPQHISKQKFAVLARSAGLGRFQTRYDDTSGDFHVTVDGAAYRFCLTVPEGRLAFEAFLTKLVSDQFSGPFKVLQGPGQHRFTDFDEGYVSLLNLASLREVEQAVGAAIHPSRFRMNIEFDGTPWQEDDWASGTRLQVGGAVLELISPTIRCKATHANPQSGIYDLDLVPLLFRHFQRNTMGVYARIVESGVVRKNDQVGLCR